MAALVAEALPEAVTAGEDLGSLAISSLEKSSAGQKVIQIGRAVGKTLESYKVQLGAAAGFLGDRATEILSKPEVDINLSDQKEEINKAVSQKIKEEGLDNPAATYIPKNIVNTMSNTLNYAATVPQPKTFNIDSTDYFGVSINPMGNPLDILNLLTSVGKPAAQTPPVLNPQLAAPQPVAGSSGGIPL